MIDMKEVEIMKHIRDSMGLYWWTKLLPALQTHSENIVS